jgi:hypothetical protein
MEKRPDSRDRVKTVVQWGGGGALLFGIIYWLLAGHGLQTINNLVNPQPTFPPIVIPTSTPAFHFTFPTPTPTRTR